MPIVKESEVKNINSQWILTALAVVIMFALWGLFTPSHDKPVPKESSQTAPKQEETPSQFKGFGK